MIGSGCRAYQLVVVPQQFATYHKSPQIETPRSQIGLHNVRTDQQMLKWMPKHADNPEGLARTRRPAKGESRSFTLLVDPAMTLLLGQDLRTDQPGEGWINKSRPRQHG